MIHDVKCLRNILVQAGLRQVVRHVVEEVDVGERPAGEVLCVRANLGNEDGGWRNDDKKQFPKKKQRIILILRVPSFLPSFCASVAL